MEFKVKSSELVAMLKIVIKGFDPRDDSSVIYFKVENDELVAVSHNAASHFSGHIPVTGLSVSDDDESIFYVDGDVLKRLSGIFPDAPVSITFSINQSSRVFVIKYTGHSFRLPIVSDTVEMPVPQTTKLGMIQAQDFFNVLNSLVKIVSTDPASQEFASSCLHLNFKQDKMYAMGTDRFALAEITKDYTPDDDDQEDTQILIRQPQAALLQKSINPAEVLTLVQTASSFGYLDGNNILSLVAKTQMTPLQYDGMKQIASDECSITTDYSDFKDTLDTIGKLSFATNTVILKIEDENKVNIRSIAGDIMDLPISGSNGIDGEQEYKFSRNVLSEALIPVDTHNIRIQWKKPDEDNQVTMFQIVPIDDDGKIEENVFIGVTPNA